MTMQISAAWRVALSFPLPFSESRLREPFPIENPCSENVLESNSLSNSSESGSTQNFLRKFLTYHLWRSSLHLSCFSSFVFPLQLRGFRVMNGIALSFLMMRSLALYPS